MKKYLVNLAIDWLMKEAMTLQEVESFGFKLGLKLSDVLKKRAGLAEQSVETMVRAYRDAFIRGYDKGTET